MSDCAINGIKALLWNQQKEGKCNDFYVLKLYHVKNRIYLKYEWIMFIAICYKRDDLQTSIWLCKCFPCFFLSININRKKVISQIFWVTPDLIQYFTITSSPEAWLFLRLPSSTVWQQSLGRAAMTMDFAIPRIEARSIILYIQLLSLQMFFGRVLFKQHAGWTFHECIKHRAWCCAWSSEKLLEQQ